MVIFSEMFVSELIGIPVVDRVQENIGRVKDIIVSLGDPFPKVSAILAAVSLSGKQEQKVLLIGEIDLIGRKIISTRSIKDDVAFTFLRDGEVLLMRDVVDQQVVDLDGARVIRVNDLMLAKVDQDVLLIAADVGVRGIFRRLRILKGINWGLKLFRKELPANLIGWDHVQGLSGGQIAVPTKSIADLHPADVAHIISQVRSNERTAIVSIISEKTAAEALHELEPMLGAALIATMDSKKALRILEKMPVDEAADIIGDLSQEKADELLRLMKIRKATEIQKLLGHRDESAGGLMTTEFITVPQTLNAEDVITLLREMAPNAETIYYLYVVDQEKKLAGILSLRSLLVSPPDKKIAEIMLHKFVSVTPQMNQREVAKVISKYNLLAVPVIDHEGKIVGIVTVDDVVDFILPPFSRRKRQMLG